LINPDRAEWPTTWCRDCKLAGIQLRQPAWARSVTWWWAWACIDAKRRGLARVGLRTLQPGVDAPPPWRR
jgi:hypothetical protein